MQIRLKRTVSVKEREREKELERNEQEKKISYLRSGMYNLPQKTFGSSVLSAC